MTSSFSKNHVGVAAPWLAWLLVMVLWCLAAWPFTHGLLMGDSARDVMQGLSVLQGDWPLLGPRIGGVWHLGSVWFYVLAGVLALTSSVSLTFLFVGFLAAAQIPLGYVFGSRLHGRRFGLFLACVLALPGVWVSAAALPTHAALVGSLVCLAGVCVQSAWRAPTVWRMALVGLVCSLACHAHPTALWLAVPVLGLLRHTQKQQGTNQALLALVWMVLAALLPLLPMLWHEWAHGFPQWQASQQYAGKHSLTSALMRWPQDAWATLNWSRTHLPDAWVAESGVGSMLLHWVWFAGLVTVPLMLFACLQRRAASSWLVPALYGLVAFTLVVCVRAETTVWMLYAVMPVAAWASAAFWWLVLGERHQRFFLAGSVVIALGLWGLVHVHLHHRAKQGLVSIAAVGMGDVQANKKQAANEMVWLGAKQLDALAKQQCSVSQAPLAGADAQAAVLAQDALRLLHCSEQPKWLLAGAEASSSAAVLLHPSRNSTLQPEWRYPPYSDSTSLQSLVVDLPKQGGWVLVTHRYPFFHPTLALTHRCDDATHAVTRMAGHQWRVSWAQSDCRQFNQLIIQAASKADVEVEWRPNAPQ